MFGSFFPKEKITDLQRREEVAKIKEACDKNGDGVIDQPEFEVYYLKVCKDFENHHKERVAKDRAAKKAVAQAAIDKEAE